MKPGRRHALVLVTAPSIKVARQVASAILDARAAACVNLVPRIESHYWWRGKTERSAEVLLLIKTIRARLPELERTVLAHHPYDTPEFIVLPISAGAERYLTWIGTSVGKPAR